MAWQINCTHMPPIKRTRYLLILVDAFLGWVEACPTTNKRASTVVSILGTEIIPHFGLPTSIQSDNGPKFTSSVSQGLAKALQIRWKFHICYHPQSSVKVECANCTLKNIFTKLSLELHLDWVKFLPLALLLLWTLPKKPLMLSPFELLYGHPLLPITVQPELPNISPPALTPLLAYLRSLLWTYAHSQLPHPSPSPDATLPSLQVGDLVYLISPYTSNQLQEKWKGPFRVILMTAKLEGHPAWVHFRNLKLAVPETTYQSLLPG
jgi:transposase InsO family protein